LSRLFSGSESESGSESGSEPESGSESGSEPDPESVAEELRDGEIRTAHMIVCVKFRGSSRVILGDATSRTHGWKWAGRVYFIVLDYISAPTPSPSGVPGCRGDTIFLYDRSRGRSDSQSGQDIENPGYIMVPDAVPTDVGTGARGPGALFLSKSMKPDEFRRLVNVAGRPFGGVPVP
jgi:hypothetical protein